MKTYDINEAADFLEIDRSTALELAHLGTLPGAKVGRAWEFMDDELIAYPSDMTRKQTQARRAKAEAAQIITLRATTSSLSHCFSGGGGRNRTGVHGFAGRGKPKEIIALQYSPPGFPLSFPNRALARCPARPDPRGAFRRPLDNKTPRQAIQTATGRERVKGLLRSYEASESRQAAEQGRREISYQFLWDALGIAP